MSGLGTSTSDTTQQSSTAPGAPAQGEVNGLLSTLQNLIPNSGVNSTEQGAINQLTATGQAGNPFAAGTTAAVNDMLSGGGATNQAPAVQQNLTDLKSTLSPYIAPDYSTLNSPAVQAALQQIQDDTTNSVNGQFAASGRSGSGMNTQTLSRGIAQGEAPIILNQANQDTATRMGAANSIYGAGNTTAGLEAGMTQQGVQNEQAGVNAVAPALTNSTWGPQTTLAAQEIGQQLPASNLGLLSQIGIPLAQLFQTSNGTSNTTNTASPIQDITSLGGLLGAGKSVGANGAMSSGSGLLGLLGMI